MTRLIDADALMPMMKYATTDSEIGVFPIKIGFNAIAKVIEDAPTVDAVPVIRCKDCKYWYKGKNINYCRRFWDDDGEPKLYRCTADDYCSGAERKE